MGLKTRPHPIKAVSLGASCTTKLQILRHNAGLSAKEFRARYSLRDDTHIFDWQVTPLSAVTAYIDRDFRGIFEQDDLEIRDDGKLWNRRFDVGHWHVSPDYDQARSKIEHLAGKFRRVLMLPGPILYIVSDTPPAAEVAALLRVLGDRQHFHIAFIGSRIDRDYAVFGSRVSQFQVVETDTWEGDDEGWTVALNQLALRFPGTYERPEKVRSLPIWMRQPRKAFKALFLPRKVAMDGH